jgi:hypothetical protein
MKTPGLWSDTQHRMRAAAAFQAPAERGCTLARGRFQETGIAKSPQPARKRTGTDCRNTHPKILYVNDFYELFMKPDDSLAAGGHTLLGIRRNNDLRQRIVKAPL